VPGGNLYKRKGVWDVVLRSSGLGAAGLGGAAVVTCPQQPCGRGGKAAASSGSFVDIPEISQL